MRAHTNYLYFPASSLLIIIIMTRKKIEKKANWTVKIRFKKLAKGNQSIYLDTYRDGQRSFEFLKGLRLLAETGNAEEMERIREVNRLTLCRAEVIRSRRVIALINGEEPTPERPVETEVAELMPLMEWMRIYRKRAAASHRGCCYDQQVAKVTKRLQEYMGKKADTFSVTEVDEDFCRGFITFLREKARQTTGKPLSGVTIYHYFGVFRNALKRAVADNVLMRNPVDKLAVLKELPTRPEVQKIFLTEDEVRRLMDTECSHEEVKRAFLFSCFCGLRISDIRALEHRNIRTEGDVKRMSVVTRKTGATLTMKLSQMALKWVPQQGNGGLNGPVFRLPSIKCIEHTLQRWAAKAGIEKHVTFHTSRHTFATMAITAGVDIYTLSKMLTHKTVQTTQIYAEVVNEKRDDAVDLLSGRFADRI